MTTKRTYFCNFCRNEETEARKMYGLLWEGSERLSCRWAGDVENHLCGTCLRAITEVGKCVTESEADDD